MDLEHLRWQRRTLPSGSAGGALIDPRQIARPDNALQIMGQVLTDEGAAHAYRLDARIARNQLGQFQIAAENAYQATEYGDDPLQYTAKYNETLDKIRSDHLAKVTHPEAREQAELWLGGRDVDWKTNVQKLADREVTRHAVDIFNAKQQLAVQQQDAGLLTEAYDNAVLDGILSPDVADYNFAYDMEGIEAGQYDAVKDAELAAAKRQPTKEEALQYIQNSPHIRETDKDGLFEDVKTWYSIQEMQEKESRYRQQETFKKEIIPLKFSDDPAKLAEARQRVMTDGKNLFEATEWQAELEDIDQKIDTLAKTAGKPFAAASDDRTYFDVSNTISGYKSGQVSRDAAYQTLVTNKEKLSEADYNRMKQTFEATGTDNDPLKNLTVQQALKDLSDLASDYYFVNDGARADKGQKADYDADTQTRLKNTQIFTAVHKAFTDWAEKHPDATDQQILEKYQSLVQPAVEKSILDSKWMAFGPGLPSAVFWGRKLLGMNKANSPAGWETAVTKQNLDTSAASDVLDQAIQQGPDTQYADDDQFQLGQTATYQGKILTYIGNGQWED